MELTQIYETYFRLVEREDRLIQQRFSNLLTTQGLLFVALGLVAENSDTLTVLKSLMNVLPLIGMAVSLSVCGTIWAGFSALHRLEKQWKVEKDTKDLPSPFGMRLWNVPFLSPTFLTSFLFFCVWLFLRINGG